MDSMIYGSNFDEVAELEAELMALQQESPKKLLNCMLLKTVSLVLYCDT